MPLSAAQLTRLIDQHWDALVIWVGPNTGYAEDVVQEAFIKISAEHPPPDHPAAWLYKVCRRLAINQQKSEQRRTRREEKVALQRDSKVTDSSLQPAVAAQLSDERSQLLAALNELDQTQRRVVIAKIWGELSLDEIADSMACSRATVWRNYQRAIRHLQQHYAKS